MGKAKKFQQDLDATIVTVQFMGQLLPRYTASDMTRMWDALGAMTKRYGIQFIADMIRNSKAETELALQEVVV